MCNLIKNGLFDTIFVYEHTYFALVVKISGNR